MRSLILILPLALAACGTADEPAPGGVTKEESQRLDAAAAATDINATVVENASGDAQ